MEEIRPRRLEAPGLGSIVGAAGLTQSSALSASRRSAFREQSADRRHFTRFDFVAIPPDQSAAQCEHIATFDDSLLTVEVAQV